jgi:hypothetical protein
MSCDAHRDALNLTFSAPSLFSSGSEDRSHEQLLYGVNGLAHTHRGDAARGERAAAGHVPGGDQHHQRSSADFIRRSGDDAVNELGHGERETQSLRDGVQQAARRLFTPSHGLRNDGLSPQVKRTLRWRALEYLGVGARVLACTGTAVRVPRQ